MDKEFVSYEQAVVLKELGLDGPFLRMSEHKKICEEQAKPDGCQLHNLYCGYPDCTIDKSIVQVPLPLKSQVFRWFREKYELFTYIKYDSSPQMTGSWYFVVDVKYPGDHKEPMFHTYEEAEDFCIDRLIELAKHQDK